MKTNAIVFDAYGTLFDTSNGSVNATSEILQKHQSCLDAAEVYSRWKRVHGEIISDSPEFEPEEVIFGKGLAIIYKEFGIDGDPADDVRIMLATLGNRNVFDDAIPCVEWCRDRFRVVLASNTDTAPLEKDIERSSLEVDMTFTSEDLRAYKPQVAFYERMLKRLHLKPEEVVFVGDSIDADVVGPKDFGMNAIWLNRRQADSPNIERLTQIGSLTELPNALAELTAMAERARDGNAGKPSGFNGE